MAKFKIESEIVVKILSDGKVKFSEEFQKILQGELRRCANDCTNVTFVGQRSSDDHCVASVVSQKETTSGLTDYVKILEKRIKLLTEHGRDADILEAVLSKHPELRKHPRVHELVGAFDNLAAKIQELDTDKKSKPGQTEPALPKPGQGGGKMSKADLVKHREEKLKGHAPDQLQRTAATVGSDLQGIVTPPAAAKNGPAANIFVPETGNQHGKKSAS